MKGTDRAFDQRAVDLVRALTKATRDGRVRWKEDSAPRRIDCFFAEHGDSKARIRRKGPVDASPWALELLVDQDHDVWYELEGAAYLVKGELTTLAEMARRQARHADKVIDQLLRGLEELKEPKPWPHHERTLLADGRDLLHHPIEVCEGPCGLHQPTSHMADWPMLWHQAEYQIYRLCGHGVQHPDPDCAAFEARRGNPPPNHECDGCCLTERTW